MSIRSAFGKAMMGALWTGSIWLAALPALAGPNTPSHMPLFVSESVPPLNMLVMGRDHKLYYEAYNDASDLNGDGVLDIGYKGYLSKEQGGFDYYGYFNSYVCYTYADGVFTPSTATTDKRCSNKWSGDYLNYLTTSRMDALRKVLYGGYRVEDAADRTVLQGAFIPQDAHTWGKEYQSFVHDGYRISDYTPFGQPVSGYRHLFAVASLTDGGVPQLRTLTNTTFRIWNWVSKERPVAGDDCDGGACTSRGPTGGWSIVPPEVLSGITVTIWSDSRPSPGNKGEMDTLFGSTYSNATSRCTGTAPTLTQINSPGNFTHALTGGGCASDPQNNYHTLIEATFTPPETGTYQFAVDGDDAVDVLIDDSPAAGYYGAHGKAGSGQGSAGGIWLEANRTYQVKFRHEEAGGDANFYLYWKAPGTGASELKNHNVKVEACPDDSTLREGNCLSYSSSHYKPTGILHDFGAGDQMYFGLLTGSYQKNLSGGVLRSALQSFSKEYKASTGQFCSSASVDCSSNSNGSNANGIVATINKLRIIDFDYGSQSYGCGWYTSGPMTQTSPDHSCYMWGNPIAEMMYETMRYFSGATTPTPLYDYSTGKDAEAPLNLPKVDTWTPPYRSSTNTGGYPLCAVPVMTVISDINPSYDYKVPGSHWTNGKDADNNPIPFVSGSGNPSSIKEFNASNEADTIWTKEGGGSRNVFIGESNGTSDSAPTEKTVSNLSTIRGISPEEPSKLGTYYSAAVAHFGANNKVGGDKKLMTYSVALASPLPTIQFPVGDNSVTIVPFAKSVGGSGISATSSFQPTNQIVDYYVETIANTDSSCSSATPSTVKDCNSTVNGGRPYAKFRINYEDVEQGADHDMDAIALYELLVNAAGNLVINMTSEYAAGGIDQHMGYVISGSTKDGIYLDVKDQGGADVAYKLDTPTDTTWAGDCGQTGASCPALTRLSSSRTFEPSGRSANFLPNPLWYAAKYGIPDRAASAVTGDPDNYFLVTNALTLKDQLTNAFNDILQRNNSVTRPGITIPPTATNDSERYVYRTDYNIRTWSGNLIKEATDTVTGTKTEEWKASQQLPSASSRNIKMAGSDGDLADANWSNLTGPQQAALATDPQVSGSAPTVDANGAPTDPTAIAKGQARLNFVLGTDTSFRKRDSLLGDIVNSSPVVVEGAQYLAYLAGTIDGTVADYAAFQEAQKTRRKQVYVGANDGMLHAFDAESGRERFAFIPSAVIPNLNQLTASDYNEDGGRHRFYVDGTPVVRDVYIAPKGSTAKEWRTVLVGTLRGGGRSLFALDVTNPDDIELLWEFGVGDDIADDAPEGTQSDVGYSFPIPTLARLHSGEWAVVTGNGYDSASGRASLLLIDIATGDLIRNIPVATTGDNAVNNGLSSVRVADNNSDGIADYVYAGDLKGNLWRFDLIDTSDESPLTAVADADDYEVSFGGSPLFTAREGNSSSDVTQPITAPPSLVRHPSLTGYIVIFGTGRYFSETDKASADMQTLFGIWDKQTKGEAASSTPLLKRSNLQAQTFELQATASFADGEASTSRTIRVLSQNSVDWDRTHINATASAGKFGWYLDLKVGSTLRGERVVDETAVRGQALLVNTRTPESDPCSAGIEGWTYGINPFTGGRTSFNVFDLNGDNTVDIGDAYTSDDGTQVASGFQTPAGGFTLSGNTLFDTSGSWVQTSFGPNASGRQTWNIVPRTTDDDDEEGEE